MKKRNRTEKSFFAGMPIAFTTNSGSYGGQVEKIKQDSIFLLQFDTRRKPTRLGVFVLDTFAVYRLTFHYKELLSIALRKHGFNWGTTGASLLGTGSLLTILGAGSWLVTKKDSRYYARPEFVAACAGLA
ncbi:MAG: hypothetical protein ABIQ56_03940, partial [Chitinophagaceae bacterium]